MAEPTNTPPTASMTKLPTAASSAKVPLSVAATAKRNSVSPVCVVEQAFALQQRLQSARKPHPLENGARRDGIGRGEDGTEREAGRPWQRRKQPLGDHCDGERGEEHRADRQREDTRQVPAETAEGGVIGSVEQQRGKEQDQRQLGIEGDLRQAGDEGEKPAADEECRRGRKTQLQRQSVQRDHRREEQEHQLEGRDRTHRGHLSARRRASVNRASLRRLPSPVAR
ncbi:hypothetical protein GCM10022280_12810 [Sphingomonas swuensis]|uniref:Uncharacterized protein n=1 Tax=Sphingomonas swuensis TaxID=977800 RepID=A0ABP7SRU1_9SPHN